MQKRGGPIPGRQYEEPPDQLTGKNPPISDRLSELTELQNQLRRTDHDTASEDELSRLLRRKQEIVERLYSLMPLTTVMYIDLCSSTRHFYERGDFDGHELIEFFQNLCLERIRERQPVFVDRRGGDQILTGFTETSVCIEAAVSVLSGLSEQGYRIEQKLFAGVPFGVSLGIHRGKLLMKEGAPSTCQTLFLAEQLQKKAGTNQILVSHTVYDELCIEPRFRVTEYGLLEISGVPEPQKMYEIDWRTAFAPEAKFNTNEGGDAGVFASNETGVRKEETAADASPLSSFQEEPEREPPSTRRITVSSRDNTADFTRIDDAVANAPDGAEIHIKSGEYRENVVIKRDNILLKAEEPSGVIILPVRGIGFRIAEAANVRIEGLLISQDSRRFSEAACIQVESARSITFRNCAVRTGNAIGCLVTNSQDVALRNMLVQTCRLGGVKITGESDVVLDGCTITDNGGYGARNARITEYGLLAERSSKAVIEKSVVGGNEGPGIAVTRGARVEISSAKIQGNGVTRMEPGVYIEDSEGSVKNCRILDNGGPGIFVKRAKIAADNNQVESNGTLLCRHEHAGVLCLESPQSKLIDNRIVNNGVDEARLAAISKRDSEDSEIVRCGNVSTSPMWYRYLKSTERVMRPKDRR